MQKGTIKYRVGLDELKVIANSGGSPPAKKAIKRAENNIPRLTENVKQRIQQPNKKGPTLEQCCRRLVALGKKQGGYITFQAISDLFHTIECEVSIEAIDRIYECLKAEGIELVDQLPYGCITDKTSWNSLDIFYDDLNKHKLKPKRRSKRRGRFSTLDQEPLKSTANIEDVQGRDIQIQDDRSYLLADSSVQILLQYIGQIKQLTANEERRLAKLAKEGDREAAIHLIEANLKHVFNKATNYVGMGLDFLDLFQEGCIGLIKALEKFDWRQGVRLSSYSSWLIFQTINRAIDDYGRAIRLPSYLTESIKKLQKMTDDFYKVHGREPVAKEISDVMGLSERKVRELQIIAQPIVSWEATLAEWEKTGAYPKWFLEDHSLSLEEQNIDRDLLHDAVSEFMAKLKPNEQLILRLSFGFDGSDPQTIYEIGRLFGVTRERVRQIEVKALKKLKHYMISNKELRDFLGY